MPTYEMTPGQRERWKARVQPLFAREGNCTELARKGRFPDAQHKTIAGYIGEFRDGQSRALTYFLDEPVRLEHLATALEATAAQLRGVWDSILEEDAAVADTLFLPGFEDWGAVPFDVGFVEPPLTGLGVIRGQARESVSVFFERNLHVVAERGAGATTLLRRFARWARDDGWRVTWNDQTSLPVGRAELLVLDHTEAVDPAGLAAWAKEKGHALLHASDGAPSLKQSGIQRHRLQLHPIDEPWLRDLVKVAARHAPRGHAQRFRQLRIEAVIEALRGVPSPSPEIAGSFLRAALDGEGCDPRLLLSRVAERRLEPMRGRGQPHQPMLSGRWLLSAYSEAVCAAEPASAAVSSAVLADAHRAVAEAALSEQQRDVLRAVLPLADSTAVIDRFHEANLLREEDGRNRFRLEPLLAASVAPVMVTNPAAIHRALVDGRNVLLEAISAVPGGPEALAAALSTTPAPVLATLVAELERHARWMRRVGWTPPVLYRFIAVVILTGHFDVITGRRARLPELWGVCWPARALVVPADLRPVLGSCAEELTLPPRELPDDMLHLCCAFVSPHPSALRALPALDSLDPDVFPTPEWIEHVAGTADGLRSLLDPGFANLALRIMRITEARQLVLEPEPLRVWLRLLEPVFASDPARAVGIVMSTFDAARKLIDDDRVPPPGAESPAMEVMQRVHSWRKDIHLLLGGVAAAIELPGARHCRDELRDRLREALGSSWEASMVDPSIRHHLWDPAEDWTGPAVLPRLLAFCYTREERAGLLVNARAELSPYWRSLLRAGVPFEAALDLLEALAMDKVQAVPGRGAPTAKEVLDNGLFRKVDPRFPCTAAQWIIEALVEQCTPEEIARLPGFPRADGGGPPDEAFVEHYSGPPHLEGRRGFRRYLWTFAVDLEPTSIAWTLLGDRPHGLRYSGLARSQPGLLPAARAKLRADLDGLSRLTRLVDAAHLDPRAWDRVANAALLAGVPAIDLRLLLEARDLAAVDADLLADVLLEIHRADQGFVRTWLQGRLDSGPAVLDRAPLARALVGAEVPVEHLEGGLSGQPANQVKGAGFIPALVQRGRARFAEWLADDATRAAALAVLAQEPDWQDRLRPVLAADTRVPPADVLRHLIRQADGRGFDLLDDASADWTASMQIELWRAAAAVATRAGDRREIWRRLARLAEPRTRPRSPSRTLR